MNLTTKTTTEFFESSYVNFASYDNIRKIPSLVDGQKNAARKVLWYTLSKNIKNEIKVSQLDSKVAEDTEYLHGTMAGVIVNLAQNYAGTNNINLMSPEGNFGTRLIPEASAPRYIYTYGSAELFDFFNKEDIEILEHQRFEGHKIEPKFLLPKLPLLLINGAEGISSGFATKILPRDPEVIKEYIKDYLSPELNIKHFNSKPFYRGFKGDIIQGENPNQWIIRGCFKQNGLVVRVTELPIGYNLNSYKKILDKLEEDKKIKSYDDLSNKDFEFKVYFTKEQIGKCDLFELLKLQRTVTENYTVTTAENRVKAFDSPNDILMEYITVKMYYLDKRKENSIKNITQDIKLMVSKYTFIQNIIENKLIITKRPTSDIIQDLEKIERIIKLQDSYMYLLQMPIYSLTEEKMNSLLKSIKEEKTKLDKLKLQTLEDIWLEEL